MIAIFDNGQDWSDHAICFVDLPDGWTADEVLALCYLQAPRGTWTLSGTAMAIKWRTGGCCELRHFLNETYTPAARTHRRWADLCALLGKEPRICDYRAAFQADADAEAEAGKGRS